MSDRRISDRAISVETCHPELISATLINTKILNNYIPITIPDVLYEDKRETQRTYASSILIISSNINICIISVYRPPITTIHETKEHIKQFQVIFDWIKQFLQHIQTGYIIVDDVNAWHESMGFSPRNAQNSMRFKYILGDLVMKKMQVNRLINIHNGDPTMHQMING